MSGISEMAVATGKSSSKRVSLGIHIVTDGGFELNEWGLHESLAATVNRMLIKNGDKPVKVKDLTFSRRAPSTNALLLAEAEAALGTEAAA